MAMFSDTGYEVGIDGVDFELISDLELYLEREDMVILIDVDDAATLTESLCYSDALANIDKRVVIIGTVDFPNKPGSHIYRTISEREMRELLNIYRSYEASDKLYLLSRNQNYGSMWNYISTGTITEEELFEAMFI